jgi:hypothetical protein
VVVTLSDSELSFDAVGETQQLTATVTENGEPVPSPSLSWTSSDAGVATVSQTGLVTSAGQGSAEITATFGDGSASASVAVTQTATALTRVSGNQQFGPPGEALAAPFVVGVEDAQGSPVPGVDVEFSVSQGGGNVTPLQGTSGADGTASATLTLGPNPGEAQEVTVVVVGSDISTTFTAATTGDPASVEVFAGNGQSAAAGAQVASRPAVRVVDGNGFPVGGVTVRFEVASGGGSVTGGVQPTNPSGVATVGGWTLGSSPINTLNATVDDLTLSGEPLLFVATTPPSTGYDLRIRYLGAYSGELLLAFAEAETRWEALVTGDLPDVAGDAPAGACGANSPAMSGPFDDLTIFVTLEPIDGPANVLGQAGPCFIRQPGDLAAIGRMRFDTDDLELMLTQGLLQDVILHEMGHVLGFGTVWELQGLLADPWDDDPQAEDPHFTGAAAIAAFNSAGGGSYSGGKVPVANSGAAGTVNSHWREPVMDPELMTGFIAPGTNPLSAITVRSLQDQGYTVNVAGADPFTLASSLRMTAARGGVRLTDDVIRDPIRRIDLSGRVTGVLSR